VRRARLRHRRPSTTTITRQIPERSGEQPDVWLRLDDQRADGREEAAWAASDAAACAACEAACAAAIAYADIAACAADAADAGARFQRRRRRLRRRCCRHRVPPSTPQPPA